MVHHVNVLKTKEIKCILTEFKKKFNKQLRHSLNFLKLKCSFLAECTNEWHGANVREVTWIPIYNLTKWSF